MDNKREQIKVSNMQCKSCEDKIARAVGKLPGVSQIKADYGTGEVNVEYNPAQTDLEEIESAITARGYKLGDSGSNQGSILGLALVVGLLVLIGSRFGNVDLESMLNGKVTYAVLFLIGVMTSLHCTGMCGGLMLSQSISRQTGGGRLGSALAVLSYHGGRVISYTLLGGVVGALGTAVSFSPQLKAGIMIFAGLFMILMGLNIGGFKAFRKYSIRLPWAVNTGSDRKRAPLVVGLLNGLMPCGPLQTMQLYALGTGSALAGAASMLAFSLGTIPLMLGFGVLASYLNKGYTYKILRFSGVLVIVLGLVMANRGLALAGINLPVPPMLAAAGSGGNTEAAKAEIKEGIQTVRMSANSRGYVPGVLVVQKGIPVRWIIDGEQLNSCNNAIVVPYLKIQKKLAPGENIVEFTPAASGDISFSCWMGMIRGVIKVVDNLETADLSGVQAPASSDGSCCAGGLEEEPSIYGDDWSKVPTDRLIKKAIISNKSQSVKFTGISSEFTPLYVLLQKDIPAKITFDLQEFSDPAGNYLIGDTETGKTVGQFTVKDKSAVYEFVPQEPGIYVVVKYMRVLGVIEVVDGLDKVDLEEVRKNNFE